MLILLCYYSLHVISGLGSLTSAIIKHNKLFTIQKDSQLGYVKCKVYELKEGPILSIVNRAKTYKYVDIQNKDGLVFIDPPFNPVQLLNKVLVGSILERDANQYGNSTHMSWMGYINIDDMSLKTDSSFIKFPTHENFPKSGYTINSIYNKFGSAIYITGGELYHENDGGYSIINMFFKYSFRTEEWIDITYSTNGKLKPVIGHSSVMVDSRYLIILGGYMNVDNNQSERSSGYESLYKYYSLYNLTVFDTFTNNWENININPSIFDTSKMNIQFKGLLSTVYNNKAYILSKSLSEDSSNTGDRNSYLGILDYSSKTWDWTPIYDEDGSKYDSSISANDIVVYKDQLIIIIDNITSTYDKATPILVLDLLTKRLKSTLRSSYRSNVKDSDSILPPYAIVLIGVGCTALLPAYIGLLYLINKKKSSSKNSKNNHSDPIPEVWSNPDIYNTNNIITWDKKKGISIKQNNLNTLYSNGLFPKPENQNTSNIIEIS